MKPSLSSVNDKLLVKLHILASVFNEVNSLFADIIRTGQMQITSDEISSQTAQAAGYLSLNDIYENGEIDRISKSLNILLKMFDGAKEDDWNFKAQYEKLTEDEKKILG